MPDQMTNGNGDNGNGSAIPRISRHLMYQEVSQRIREFIEREGIWGQYLAPERDLARMFGVSRETLRRGLELLEEQSLVQRRHGQGTLVLPRSAKPKLEAKGRVVVASYTTGDGSSYVAEMISGLTGAAGQAGWLVSFCNLLTPAARQGFFEDLARGGVDGVLLLSLTDRALVAELLEHWKGPTVLVDHHFDDLPVTGVIDDSESGARQAVEHLLALGHRRIGYVDVARRYYNPWRYAGYAGALERAGIAVDQALVAQSFGSFESGRRAGEELLSLPDPPSAVFAFDDVRAWGVWRAAEARGLEVGKDLALVGFGDSAAKAGFPEEALSSVRFDSRAMGRSAAEKLSELIAGKGRPGELVKVPTELVVRKSSQDVRPAGAAAKSQEG